jgi:hypothetical protein
MIRRGSIKGSRLNLFSTSSIEDGAMTKADLEQMRAWAHQKIATGTEPPWAWYQYMKLRETLDAILAGMAATTEDSRQPVEPPERRLQLVGQEHPREIAPRPPATQAVQLPM